MARNGDNSIIVLDKFIQATRDSGYKGTVSAVSELVDNALQAGAKRVVIEIGLHGEDAEHPLRVSVLDDGSGMDRRTLRQALRFGGSSRFNDRSGLGRFGMGLPNSSLSQALRVDVYSWTRPRAVLFSYLDVDEIAGGRMIEVPEPESAKLPEWAGKVTTPSGTLVVWSRCDRLDHRRISTVSRRLVEPLGRVFRYYLWKGVKIVVNGAEVEPIDPLYLRKESAYRGASVFQQPMVYPIDVKPANGHPATVGNVTVTFSELPVHHWHDLPNDEKRQMRIANGAGVSVVRADREIDFGWFFLGGKRRENYDDWWRCEVRFDPVLDEAFGITHTKQQIRPQDYLTEILGPDMENTAKALNSRIRQVHSEVRAKDRTVEVEERASQRDNLLTPLPKSAASQSQAALFRTLADKHPAIQGATPTSDARVQYRIVQESLKDEAFYSWVLHDGMFVLVLNPDHPFYKKVYKPLIESDAKESKEFRSQIELMLLSCARAEAATTRHSQKELLEQLRKTWGDNLAAFLNG